MNREQAKNHVKAQLESYLQQKDINTAKPFHCLNPDHNDQNPSMSYDRNRNKAHCFSCGVDYDIFDLIGIDHSISEPGQIFKKSYDIYGINPIGNIEESLGRPFTAIKNLAKTEGETDYFLQRGITEEVIKRYNLRYNPQYNHGTGGKIWKAAIIPTGPDSYKVRNTDPQAEKKNRYRNMGSSEIFNQEALRTGKPVFITEGEIDALSIITAGGESIALGSTANVNKFISKIEQTPPAGILIIALDNDTEGEKASQKLQEALTETGIPHIVQNVSGSYKDPNKALTTNKKVFINEVQDAIDKAEKTIENKEVEERRQYIEKSAAYYLPAFTEGIQASVNTPSISTGFPQLDNALEGGLYEGLYIIGAVSSLGKTTFMLQVMDQIAEQGNDVLIFSLEMARFELMAKSISRHTFIGTDYTNYAKTALGITTGKRYEKYNQTEKDLIVQSQIDYSEYAHHIFIHEGIGNINSFSIRTQVERHIKNTERKPVVLIDYLQQLAPVEPRATDKQNTDKAVIELKRISRDYKIPLLAVSSFNRASYSNKVTMEAFKESGAIEYSSDVLIGLQLEGTGEKGFDVNKARQKNPRNVEAYILKNRHGKSGLHIPFKYYPMFNYFIEVGG